MSNPQITNLLVSMDFTFSCGIYFFTQPRQSYRYISFLQYCCTLMCRQSPAALLPSDIRIISDTSHSIMAVTVSIAVSLCDEISPHKERFHLLSFIFCLFFYTAYVIISGSAAFSPGSFISSHSSCTLCSIFILPHSHIKAVSALLLRL